MNKPRILTVVRPAEGGIRAHIKTLVQELHEDFSFSVVCPPEQSADFKEYGCEVVPVPMRAAVHPLHDLRALMQMHKNLKNGSYSLVHAHGFKAALLARPVAGYSHTPCLVTVHGDFAHAASSPLAPVYRWVEAVFAGWATGYITVADWLAEELQAVYSVDGERIAVIPNGIRFPAVPQAGNAKDVLPFSSAAVVIGTVARLAPQKGIEYFIKAAALLSKIKPDLRFVVVGDGPQRRVLELLSRNLGLTNKLYFAGARQNVADFLAGFTVFVQPSVSEGQGITALEAMAAGCPVVASAVGGLRELIRHGDNGLLVPPGEPQALAGAVNRLLGDELLRASLAQQGLAVARRYSVAEMVNRTRALYAQIVDGRWPA
ncbi:glycosyltransferase family 4 protein [Dethiobacter alkaliphilus]|uniref:glycosyltransferase family 4 protein n=1 Tax=Dethiobacter alkaliphilus TaxID=427926 RepID=UPI002227F848|nr:glycosyltransferase family 4 protein [Dethiobacter alkaliphilus]MCW3490103.1 glycosyltransferase family 4 protein [Dethiobacter alkaliphilus]